jgi:LPS-assembly protein
MRRLGRALALAAALAITGTAARAQTATTLVADQVEIRADRVLVATGAVEVLHDGIRLQASRIAYDAATETLTIDGPITLTDASGTVVLADTAELGSDLREGLLQSARVVLADQLQMASTEVLRVGGRYTQLGRSVASSCQVCAENPVPLWEIRARRVVHDQLERQIYFEDAQLRLGGVPVFYLPRLRMPDPTLDRARGFLRPSLRITSQLGPGLQVPYFFPLGDSRDLTIEPYVSTENMRTLGARYRQAFRTGEIEVTGALSQDQIIPDTTRWFLFADGAFTLPRDFTLSFDVQTASDNTYLLDYGVSDSDQLESSITLERVRPDSFIAAELTHFESIRFGDDNTIQPSTVADLSWTERFTPPWIGGIGTFRLESHSHARSDTPEGIALGAADGRDIARLLTALGWRRDWVLPGGVVGTALSEVMGDVTLVRDDPAFPAQIERTHAVLGGQLRWPLLRHEASGATTVLEPVAQLVWAPETSANVPNEDSVLVEFDQGNLLALDRFPGSDAVETGARAAYGLAWTRFAPGGGVLGLSFGQVLRLDASDQFSPASGLAGEASDWLLGVQYTSGTGINLIGRALFDDGFSATKTEARMTWAGPDFWFSTGYIWGESDLTADLTSSISELTINGAVVVAGNWTGRANIQHDFTNSRASNAGIGVEYRNECLLVDLYLSRRFTSSTSVDAETEFTFAVDLLGLGGSAAPGPARRCRG